MAQRSAHPLRNVPIIAGVAWATVAQALDGRMLAVTLPSLRGHLGAGVDQGNWVIILYLMTNFAVLPLSPWLSARLGRRRYFILSIAGFTVTSALCATCSTLGELLVWRALQGAFGAGLIAVSQAILRVHLPDTRLGVSQVIFAGTFVGAPLALGPLIGGYVIDNDLSWRMTFAIDSALGLVSTILCLKALPEHEPAHKRDLDVVGAILVASAFVPLQYVLYEGERYRWLQDERIATLTVIAVCAALGFILWELRARTRLLDYRIAVSPLVGAGSLLVVPVAVVLSAVVTIVLRYSEEFLRFTATLAGELAVVRALIFVPLIILLGVTIDRRRLPIRTLLVLGLGLLAASSVMQAFATTTDSGFTTVAVAFAIGGIAIAPTVVPLFWAFLRSVPRSHTLEATTILGLGLQLGAVATPAIVQTALADRFAFHYDVLRSSAIVSRLPFLGLPPHVNAAQLVTKLVTEQSYTLAFADVAIIVALIAAASLVIVPLFRSSSTTIQPFTH